jgi:hypothetical protein
MSSFCSRSLCDSEIQVRNVLVYSEFIFLKSLSLFEDHLFFSFLFTYFHFHHSRDNLSCQKSELGVCCSLLTAHPGKFQETISQAIHRTYIHPPLIALQSKTTAMAVFPSDQKLWLESLKEMIITASKRWTIRSRQKEKEEGMNLISLLLSIHFFFQFLIRSFYTQTYPTAQKSAKEESKYREFKRAYLFLVISFVYLVIFSIIIFYFMFGE